VLLSSTCFILPYYYLLKNWDAPIFNELGDAETAATPTHPNGIIKFPILTTPLSCVLGQALLLDQCSRNKPFEKTFWLTATSLTL
jgi:hypothetical protein